MEEELLFSKDQRVPGGVGQSHAVGVRPIFNLELHFRFQLKRHPRAEVKIGCGPSGGSDMLLKPSGHQFVHQLEEGDEIALPCSVGADQDI